MSDPVSNESLLPQPSMYERMKAKNIDMSWYERGKSMKAGGRIGEAVAIDADECGLLSLYLWKANGQLWTFTTGKHDEPVEHKKVRESDKPSPHNEDVILCMSCRTVYTDLVDAKKHYSKQEDDHED